MDASELGRTRTPIGELVLFDNRVMVHTIDEGAAVDRSAAVEVLAKTEELAAGEPIAVVVDLTRVAFADHSARDTFARDGAGGAEIATALVASARITEFLAGQFMKTAELTRPVRLFDSVDEAVQWAAEQVANPRGG